MRQRINNYVFIDGTNLHLTYEYLDWDIDYKKLLIYLRKKHNITTAYYFMGYIKRNKGIYEDLEDCGYTLQFREISEFPTEAVICPHCNKVVEPAGVKTKCDCDADITLRILKDIREYDRAILITSDGDFNNLVRRLIQVDKLKLVLAPCKEGCSRLLKSAARGRIGFLDNFRGELEKV